MDESLSMNQMVTLAGVFLGTVLSVVLQKFVMRRRLRRAKTIRTVKGMQA